MKTYRRLLLFASPLRTFFPWYLLSIVLATVFSTLNFTFFAPILNVLFNNNVEITQEPTTWTDLPTFEFSEAYFTNLKEWGRLYLTTGTSPLDVLFNVCVMLVVFTFIANFFHFLAGYFMASVKGKVVRKIRTAVHEKILELHLSFFSDKHRGDIISRMTNDVQEIETTLIQTFNTLIKQPLTIIFTFGALFYISTPMTLFSLVILPISAILIALITKRLRRKAKKGQHFLGEILSSIDETLTGVKVIQSFTAEEYMNDKFYQKNKIYEKLLRQIGISRSLASPISQFFGILVVVVILYYGGKLIFTGEGELELGTRNLDPGNFLVFIILFASVISPIKAVANMVGIIQRGLVAGERLFTILDKEVLVKSKEGAEELKEMRESLSFENVVFKYDETEILKRINLEIKKGETVALVGPSGGGKSTMIDLIPRFHDVFSGSLLIDGKNIKDYDLQSLRKQMGIVTQKPILFHDTVYNNIAFGMDVTMEKVEEAAKIANAHDFIMGLDNGYDTLVGDGGGKLSGGQQQRITIARAVLKNPAIFLLDEATSALDTESEKLIQEAFDNIMKDKTSIVIAHRLSTVRNADKIVVLKAGEVVEVGTHDELIKVEDGLYQKLANMQNT
ncbi:MAG: ABC transporter ATP-binding protein [Cytophagales bacterium]|nr:ABC transporter ATP-binding protein [Cytophagales bacterium]